MSFHAQYFISETGLQFDSASKTFYGQLHGYPVFVHDLTSKNQIIVRITAKQREERDISGILQEWRMQHAGINHLQYANRMLTCVFSVSGKTADQVAVEHTGALTALAADLGLLPCCAGCGTELGYSQYLLDGSGVTLCPGCVTYTEGNMQKDTAEHEAVPVNHLGAILGAVIGGLAVFGLTYVVLEMNTLSFLTAYAGMLLGLFLIKKLGKKLTVPATALAVVLGLAAVVAAPILSYAGDFAKFNREQEANAQAFMDSYDELAVAMSEMSEDEIAFMEAQYGESLDLSSMRPRYEACKLMIANQTTGDCLKNFKTLLESDTFSGVKPELIKCIVWGILSVILGTAITAPAMIRLGQGKHTLRELPA